MTDGVKRLIESGNIKTLGVVGTFLAVMVSLILQITSKTDQQIQDLRSDFKELKIEMKVVAKDQANSSLRVAVLETQYDIILKTMDRIEAKLDKADQGK